MSPDALIALFSSTGLATILGIAYQIFKERKINKQKDLAGDLSLGELFQETARRQVVQMQRDIDRVMGANRRLQAKMDQNDREIRELRSDLERAEDYINTLLAAWPSPESQMPPVPLWQSHLRKQ